MRKQFKSIVDAFMMVVMLITFSVPAMAAEQTLDVDNATILTQTAETAENVENAANRLVSGVLIGEFHYTGRLTKGKVLGTVDVSKAAKTVKWTVGRTGSNGLVNLAITNVSTGEVRHISTLANNTLDSMTWVSILSAGSWKVSVDYVASNWLYDVDLYFYT